MNDESISAAPMTGAPVVDGASLVRQAVWLAAISGTAGIGVYTDSTFLVLASVAALAIDSMFWRWMMLRWRGLADLEAQRHAGDA